MIAAIKRLLRRDTATVPSMDGALRPNQALDQAKVLAACSSPDNAVLCAGRCYFSSGGALLRCSTESGETEEARRFDDAIIAIAASPDGALAVALAEKGIVLIGGAHDGAAIAGLGPKALTAITALAFADEDTLIACVGSDRVAVDEWQRDLLEQGENGSVWRVALQGAAPVCIAMNLAYPSGLMVRGERIIISETWRHRLIALPAALHGRVQVVLDDLPGYPGRLAGRSGGGAWLSVFAPRSQLVEFVLREHAFRRHMMDRIDSRYWIAPALRAGRSFKEPMQVGAVKTGGWSAARGDELRRSRSPVDRHLPWRRRRDRRGPDRGGEGCGMTAVLEFQDVTKEYHGVAAVQDVSLSIAKGEVHALLGENGAGKSTLTKMAAGVVPVTRGAIFIDGQQVTFQSPADALRQGIAMVFQETSLVPSLTVAQNLYLGDEKTFNRLRPLYIAAQQFLQSLNFPVDPTASVSTLGAAQRQMVEIARAVRKNAKIIIFDEPTATLTPEEKQHFFELIARLKASGCSIVFISHALEEALAISDRITVMRDGRLVITDDTRAFNRDRIISAMVGRDLSEKLYHEQDGKRRVRPYGRRVLSVQNVSMGSMVRNTSFAVYAGQVTGIFGLIGSGRTETAKIVSGVVKRNFFHGGVIRLGSKTVRYRTPASGVRDGITYVTEDRKVEGIFETMSIAESIEIGKLASPNDWTMITRRSQARALAAHWTKALNIRAISPDAAVIELSGGNQQKVVIAKALAQNPQLVIFDEPTRGVDVGAIAEIHLAINRLADEGLAVVIISSYLPEIVKMSDRILVARKGRIVEEFSGDEATEEKIMYAAVH